MVALTGDWIGMGILVGGCAVLALIRFYPVNNTQESNNDRNDSEGSR